MAKLLPSVSLSNSTAPHLMDVRFPYEWFEFREELKQLAGVRWEAKRKVWEVSRDLESSIKELAAKHEVGVLSKLTRELSTPPKEIFNESDINPKLYPYQREGVLNVLQQRSMMLSYGTGLGKTPTTIEAMRLSKVQRILVVCPAMVRLVWVDELKKWWPAHHPVSLVEKGACAEVGSRWAVTICVTSYSLVTNPKFQLEGWDMIILDESHYCGEPDSHRSACCLLLSRQNPNAYKIALTATPITSEPKGLFHQLHILYPGRFGTKWAFWKRYCRYEENQWGGMEVWGLNEDLAEELKARISGIVQRVTKKEVAHLLPPYTVQMVRVKSDEKLKVKELMEEFAGADMHRQTLDNFLTKAGPLKIPIAIEHVLESLKEGSTHMMVLTHFKVSAKAIYEGLLGVKDVSVYHYDGEVSASERNRITKEAASAKRAVIVSTMHAVKEGIDLTKFSDSIAAELYWQPATIIQLLGRYHRLSSKMAARFRFLVLAGSLDEIIAKVLRRRINDMGKLVEHDVSEEKFQEAFAGKPKSETEVLEELRQVAAGRTDFDEYI